MITPVRLDLTVQRGTPFVYRIDFESSDFARATMAMRVRPYCDAPGWGGGGSSPIYEQQVA